MRCKMIHWKERHATLLGMNPVHLARTLLQEDHSKRCYSAEQQHTCYLFWFSSDYHGMRWNQSAGYWWMVRGIPLSRGAMLAQFWLLGFYSFS